MALNRRHFLATLGAIPAVFFLPKWAGRAEPSVRRLFLDAGDESGAAFWSGFTEPSVKLAVGTTRSKALVFIQQRWDSDGRHTLHQVTQPLEDAWVDVTRPANQLRYVMRKTGLSASQYADSGNHLLYINPAANTWTVLVIRVAS